MQFKVIGAHRETGQDMAVTIDAPTPSAAEEQANSMNMLVERLDVASSPSPPHMPKTVYTSRPVQTTEQTGKSWKGAQLLGALGVIFGFTWSIIAVGVAEPGETFAAAFGGVILVVSFIVYIAARIGAWWHHG